jgi:molybdopterin biosynthesis enzyme
MAVPQIHIVEAARSGQMLRERGGEVLDGRVGLEQGAEVEPLDLGVTRGG